MQSISNNKMWPWILGGCSLLVALACILTLAFSAGGLLIASKLGSKQASVKLTPETAALQNLQGWVEVESDKGDWSPAAADQLIKAGQHVRTGKLSNASLLFNDGSQAFIKAESEIAVDELNAQKNGKPRSIVMTQVTGESSHQVIPNKSSESRYEVRTPSGDGVAKGTEFEVVVTPEQTAYYYVTEGVVAVSALETTVLVNPGFMTVLYFNQPPIEPVQTISVEGLVSQTGDQWTVAGTTFITNKDTRIVGSPQVGDWVVAKGHVDENSQNVADWVILLRSTVTNRFNLTGTVETMDAGQWKINGQTITITETTELDEAIQVGDTVYVSGLVEAGGALQAVQIERIAEETGLPFSFTGIVQKIEGNLWQISGIPVKTDDATTLTEGLKAGDQVLAKGRIQSDGTWLAQKITLASDKESDFTFTGKLESKDPWKVAGITFETRNDTVIPEDLKTGDLVRVEGVIDPSGVWVATQIERLDNESSSKMILIGTVMGINPWVVSGITLNLSPDAVIAEKITVGTLVRVELVLLPDGTWQVVKIEPVSNMVWFPGCMDVIATVVSVNGNQLQLLNWPVMPVADGATIEGTLAPNSVIRMRVCFDQAMLIKVTYIVIIQPGTVEQPPENNDGGDEGGKVTVCHKPNGKKGGHTLTIGRSALPAHLGHGDYEGACR